MGFLEAYLLQFWGNVFTQSMFAQPVWTAALAVYGFCALLLGALTLKVFKVDLASRS